MTMSGALHTVNVLNNIPEVAFQFKQQISNREFLESNFLKQFSEALIPINPKHWPACTAGSAFNSEMPDLEDKILSPLNNLESALEYLTTSQSDSQYRERFWEVTQDTAIINNMCELGSELGAFAAGSLANDLADKYTFKAVMTSASLNDQEILNNRIFQQVAVEQNINPQTVRGTGLYREFVSEGMKGDLCDRSEQGIRPKDIGFRNDHDDFWGNGPFDGKKSSPNSSDDLSTKN